MWKGGGIMNKTQKLVSIVVMGMSLLSVAPALAQITPGEVMPSAIQPAIGLASSDVRVTVARIIRVAMGLLGIIAVVIILIGGFTWMTAGGNDEKVGEAKKWIFSGVIGLAIVLSAYAIATFVINQLITATT